MWKLLTKSLLTLNCHYFNNKQFINTTAVYGAARKGTREKARKKKVKIVEEKVGFIPHNQREKRINLQRENLHVDDSWKQVSTDNCFVRKYYRWPVYTVSEAIQCHRETHHPTMYNEPNAKLMVNIELNMQAEKSTRFIDNFQRMVMIKHKFNHDEERRIIVFTKGDDELTIAREAGASLVGGVELIKNIINGEILLNDYQYVIAHPNILPELVTLRGLMKRKFPNPKSETLGTNLTTMIKRYVDGISYMAIKDEYQKNFGLITTCIGTLNMDDQHLEENLICMLQDVNSVRPKREGQFITRVLLISRPSSEKLKINPFCYIPEYFDKNTKSVDEDVFNNRMVMEN